MRIAQKLLGINGLGVGAWRLLAVSVWCLWLSAALVGCGGASGGSGDGAGDSGDGDEVRLVVLSPGLAAIVRALGREDVVVGRHAFDSWTGEGVPAVGDNLGIDYEALLGVEPDVVVMERSATAPPARLGEVASAGGFEVVRVPMLELSDIRSAIGVVDRLTRGLGVGGEGDGGTGEGLSDAAEGLVDRFDAAFSEDARAGAGFGRVVVIGAVSPLSVTGPGSFHHDILGRIGAEALPGEGSAWMRLSVEDVAALAPDTVVLLSPGDGGVDPSSAMPALSRALPGVFGAGRVVVVSRDDAMLPGPGLIGVAERLKEAGRGMERVGGGG
jgi:ABC-type Fe3+-hydroxamate transport system substrate-binding protein